MRIVRWANRAVLAVVYLAFAIVALERWRPEWICAIVGHDPGMYRWVSGRPSEGRFEEATCRTCGRPIRRDAEASTA